MKIIFSRLACETIRELGFNENQIFWALKDGKMLKKKVHNDKHSMKAWFRTKFGKFRFWGAYFPDENEPIWKIVDVKMIKKGSQVENG